MLVSKAVAACTAGIIVPLYIYPSGTVSCDQWTPLISSLNAHPSLPFTIIVNPNSGPGGSTLPDAEYQKCLPRLRTTSNTVVKLVGYVATGFGSRNTTLVNADVTTYSNWPTSFKPDGIFFDEVTTDTGHAAQYNTFVSKVKSLTWHSSSKFTVFNPGTNIPDAYFTGGVDLVVTAENFFSSFNNNQLVLNDPNQPPSKLSVILHDAPSTVPTATVNQLLTTDKLNTIFITDIKEANNPYGSFPSFWTSFVSAVASAAGGC